MEKGCLFGAQKETFTEWQNGYSKQSRTKTVKIVEQRRWTFMVNLFNIWVWDLSSVKYLGVLISINQKKITKWRVWLMCSLVHSAKSAEQIPSFLAFLHCLSQHHFTITTLPRVATVSNGSKMSHIQKPFINPKLISYRLFLRHASIPSHFCCPYSFIHSLSKVLLPSLASA